MREIQWTTYGMTVIHPFALAITIMMGILVLLLKDKRSIVVPILIGSLFITEMQRVVIFSLDFNMIRILVIFGWVRILLRGELQGLKINKIDHAVFLYSIATVLFYTLLWRTRSALVSRLGVVFSLIGLFFLFKAVIRTYEDIVWVFKVLAIICAPIALAMFVEFVSQRNMFAVFGGVPPITTVRDGRLRCQGAFSHPILAGTFGATLFPLFAVLWFREVGRRSWFIVGAFCSFAITFFSASSGPLLSLAASIMAITLWVMRKHMRAIKWGFVFMLIGLHIVMEAPVWALVARVGVVGGSTGYHRFALIDNFIRRFREWYLVGTRSTAHWGWGLQDVTNQYVRIGINGGIITLSLFLLLIIRCAQAIHGSHLVSVETWKKYTSWALGSALFAHLVSFLGVSYFDQIIVSWYLLLSMISVIGNITISEKLQVQLSPVGSTVG